MHQRSVGFEAFLPQNIFLEIWPDFFIVCYSGGGGGGGPSFLLPKLKILYKTLCTSLYRVYTLAIFTCNKFTSDCRVAHTIGQFSITLNVINKYPILPRIQVKRQCVVKGSIPIQCQEN